MIKLSKVFGTKKQGSGDSARRRNKANNSDMDAQQLIKDMEMSCSTATHLQLSESSTTKHRGRGRISGDDSRDSTQMKASEILAQLERYGSVDPSKARRMFAALRGSQCENDEDSDSSPLSEIDCITPFETW